MNPRIRAAALAAAVVLALPVVASAAHWPNFGGDAGRSGYQPVFAAGTPTELKWTADDAGTIRNSIVTTAGPSEAERFLAYGRQQVGAGLADDRANVHLRSLKDGAQRIAAAAQDVDDGSDDPDAFGSTSAPGENNVTTGGIGVSFVDSSTPAGPGQLFVVHNDTDSAADDEATCPADVTNARGSTNDIAIAQFDEKTGTKVRDVAVGPAAELPVSLACPARPQPANGYTIQSSPVITPPLDSAGTRWIFFLARNDTIGTATPVPRLFGVKVENAASPEAVVHAGTPQVREVEGANTLAGPSIAYLREPGGSGVVPYVVVPTTGSTDIQTFKAEDIGTAGPAVPAGIPGDPGTVSVPVASGGMLPGQPGSGVEKASAIFAAYDTGTQTVVRKFEQVGDSAVLAAASGSKQVAVEGRPSPALAITATAQSPGRVVLATGQNLVLLDSTTLEVADRFRDVDDAQSPEPPLTPGSTGFSRNVPAASGGLVFITNDSGQQLVLRESDGEPVGAGEFAQAAQNVGAAFGMGQPAYAEGNLQFLTDRGVFVYRTAVATRPPVASLTLTPNPAKAGEPVAFDATGSSDPDGEIAKYEWDIGDGRFVEGAPRFEFAYPQPGTFRVRLRVTDDHGATAIAARDLEISGGQAPIASFTASPHPARTGQAVTFDARGSRDADGRIVRYEWDLDADGDFEVDAGGTPSATRAYDAPGIYNVRLRVTDDRGLTAETMRQLAVTRAPRREPGLTARVSPKRDRTLPYRFRTRGRLTLPSGMKRSDGCRGRVVVVVKAGRNTISRRVSRVDPETCRYRTRVTFDDRERLDTRTRLRFKARFRGNRFLLPKSARTRTVRIR